MGSFNGMPSRTKGAPASFDRSSQHRRSMLGKVHIAKAQLGLDGDDYAAVLLRVTSRTSAADCTERELADLLGEFQRLGFKPLPKKGVTPAADHPAARKARALWISLHQLGAICDPSEAALEAFARRQLGCDRLQWANQALSYRLIEALKAIAARHGWHQSVEGVRPAAIVLALKRRLVEAQVVKLRAAALVPAEWSVERTIFDLTGIELSDVFGAIEELDRVARALGVKLRAATGQAGGGAS